MSYPQGNLHLYRAISTISLSLSLCGSIMYYKNPNTTHTPFTPHFLVLTSYWFLIYVRQIGLTIASFIANERRISMIYDSGWHFPIFNILHYVWTMLFINQYFIFAELILLLNLINLLEMFSRQKTYGHKFFSDMFLLHVTVLSCPLSWVVFAIMWNGSLLCPCPDNQWTTILGNISIWAFLSFGLFFVLKFKDWTTGAGTSLLMAALGIDQSSTKLFGPQWIFAFVISGVLVSVSVFTGIKGKSTSSQTEHEPLLQSRRN
ncbi:uncharacterized protein J8A68_005121 [[Candida] subhashii]|uniref:DUF1774-domain-containing protein n=1 Tax=[Candida] subhashii TaxID=561895 RepID=A0A8J5QN00_9ASCO|nr:uncharacterized protein J8A68_005121 [[Candida] subhashii]KAG7661330.1 hypothetical protein J8A68_005121 [[Candida] subhashii]